MFLNRRISSFYSLLVIALLALLVGAYTIYYAHTLSNLQKPLPFYLSSTTTHYAK